MHVTIHLFIYLFISGITPSGSVDVVDIVVGCDIAGCDIDIDGGLVPSKLIQNNIMKIVTKIIMKIIKCRNGDGDGETDADPNAVMTDVDCDNDDDGDDDDVDIRSFSAISNRRTHNKHLHCCPSMLITSLNSINCRCISPTLMQVGFIEFSSLFSIV